MEISELTETDLPIVKYTVEIDELPTGDPADSGWLVCDQEEGVVTGYEYEEIEGQKGVSHGGYEIGPEIWRFDLDEVLEEAEKRLT